MDREAIKILESIEIPEGEALLFELRQRLLVANIDEARQIIEELKGRGKSHVLGHTLFDDQPYYFLFEAYAHYLLSGEQDKAADLANRAVSLFHLRNLKWNEALTHWFLYVLYNKYSRKDEACKELQLATAILEGIAKDFQLQGRVSDCLSCQGVLRQLYRCINLYPPMGELIAPAEQKGYLLPPWMPVYENVEGNLKNHPLWADPSKDKVVELQLVIIGERWYSVKSVQPDSNKILLESGSGFEYGWAKVQGQDMNAAKPVDLQDGDYVLFIKRGEVQEDELVVASCWKDQEKNTYAYIVRKCGKKASNGFSLYAESSEVGDRYKPLPVGEDIHILGHVVAVAKPIKTHRLDNLLVIEQNKNIPIPPQKLTPHYLSTVISPYFDAFAAVQKIVCEYSKQPNKEIEIKVIKQFSPFSIGLDGIIPGAIELIKMTRKWQIEHEKKMAKLIEEETRLNIELKEKEVQKVALENEKLKLENRKLRQELQPSLEASLTPLLPPNLSRDDMHALLDRLAPPLLSIALNPLVITSIDGERQDSYVESGPDEDTPSAREGTSGTSPFEGQTDEELYRSLVAMSHKDEELVQRLIDLEMKNEKGIDRREAMERALFHWLRQNK
ncbi:MAG TPA: hypothetical protein VMC09_05590 [Anaerolineales bacterium]|nr:hypothetical protein [Anaerolineales bacterium]